MASATSSAPSRPEAGLGTRLVRGGLWGVSGHALTLLCSLAATPFTIRLLGTERYGLLALVNVVIGYLAFADLGMSQASTRFATAAYAQGDEQGEVRAIWTSLLVGVIPAALGSVVLVLSAPFVVDRMLHLPTGIHSDAIVALRLAGLGFIGRSISAVVNTPQLVRLRMDLYSGLNAASAIAQICLVPVVLWFGAGLVGAVALITLINFASAAANWVLSKRLLSAMGTPRVDRTLVAPLLKFGYPLVLCFLAEIVLVNSEKLFLSRFASIRALAYYSVASSFAGLLAAVPNVLGQSLLPAFVTVHAQPDLKRLQVFYGRALRGMLFSMVPAVFVLWAIAKPFLSAWAGAEYGSYGSVPCYVLVVGVAVSVMGYIPQRLLMAAQQTATVAQYNYAELAPYLVVAALLTVKFGAIGAAAAWSLRAAVHAGLLFLAAARVTGPTPSLMPSHPFDFALSAVLLFLAVVFTWAGVAPLWVSMLVLLVSLGGYASVLWVRVVEPDERLWFRRLISRSALDNGSVAAGAN